MLEFPLPPHFSPKICRNSTFTQESQSQSSDHHLTKSVQLVRRVNIHCKGKVLLLEDNAEKECQQNHSLFFQTSSNDADEQDVEIYSVNFGCHSNQIKKTEYMVLCAVLTCTIMPNLKLVVPCLAQLQLLRVSTNERLPLVTMATTWDFSYIFHEYAIWATI